MAARALILVDIQNDFLPPSGSLAVSEGRSILPVVYSLLSKPWNLLVASQDHHPPGHVSFASSHKGRQAFEVIQIGGRKQELWPDHCVQGTKGAAVEQELWEAIRDRAEVVRKGENVAVDAYSAFALPTSATTSPLTDLLVKHSITQVYICGLATDYCVRETALSALEEAAGKWETFVLSDACKAVDGSRQDEVLKELERMGARIVNSSET